MRWSSLKRLSRRYGLVIVTWLAFYYFGLFAMIFQTSIREFDYPLDEPIFDYVNYWIAQKRPIREPINFYNYTFIHEPQIKCQTENGEKLRLVYLVKSASSHFNRRNTIRKTWGFEQRFSDVQIRTVFVLGAVSEKITQDLIDDESGKYGDIIQANFIDNYYNNTIKMMMSISWAMKNCGNSKLYFFADDDMYVSTKNVLRFTRNPLNYPRYLEENIYSLDKNRSKFIMMPNANSQIGEKIERLVDFDLPDDAELYAGYVFAKSRPHRHQTSKWYTPLNEYPYNYFPPYVTAASIVISNVALRKFYYGSFYVKHFRFDDIYFSILAKKLRIVPLHNEEFYFDKKHYDFNNYRYVVASHGFADPEELRRVWEEQKGVGNA